MAQPIVTWRSFGHLARHRILGRTTVMATDPAEVDRAFTVPLAELLAEGTFSKSGGDVNWLDRAPTLTATSRSTSTECPETSSGCNRARSHRVALRRHRRRLAEAKRVWP